MRIVAIDHLVLRSPDVERSLDFYCGLLGMEGVRVAEWRAGEAPFPSVRASGSSIIDLVPLQQFAAESPRQQLDHFCLTVAGADVAEVERALAVAGVAVVERGQRFGAQGTADSLYVIGPEGVKTELRVYG